MTDDEGLESDTAGGSEPSASDPDSVDRTGPLGDLAASVADRGDVPRGGTETSSPEVDELFDREDVADIDRDRLWQRLEDDETAVPPRDEERELREIEVDGYCHQCEHFASPPTVACTREGTDILEMPSLGRFRVADCPVVLEDEALEKRE
ncbi:hypothetical protein [Haloterrigena salinisoli]|uniref:hypothetical protein n=1 Tax=Haloterrigena salinisoli TaxID=3132747 RepID=UPI0030CFA53C